MNPKRTMSQALHAGRLTEEAAAFLAAGAAASRVIPAPPDDPLPESLASIPPVAMPVAAPESGEPACVHSLLPVERRAGLNDVPIAG